MDNIIKIIKALKESGLLIKVVRETIKNKAIEQKGGFISILLDTLAATLLGNILTGKGVELTKRPGWGVMEARKGAFRAGQDFEYHRIP